MRHRKRCLALATIAPGCGATTLRLELAPTLDSATRPGFEAAISVGFGLPLDFKGRSHHYLQARGGGGGGFDGRRRAAMGLALLQVEHRPERQIRPDVDPLAHQSRGARRSMGRWSE